jgi:hypothetical protein
MLRNVTELHRREGSLRHIGPKNTAFKIRILKKIEIIFLAMLRGLRPKQHLVCPKRPVIFPPFLLMGVVLK